jgi:hypothetical protein
MIKKKQNKYLKIMLTITGLLLIILNRILHQAQKVMLNVIRENTQYGFVDIDCT